MAPTLAFLPGFGLDEDRWAGESEGICRVCDRNALGMACGLCTSSGHRHHSSPPVLVPHCLRMISKVF